MILVTGATGFIGSAIVRQCQQSDIPVRTTGRSQQHPRELPNYTPADLNVASHLPPLLNGVTTMVHAAGLAHQFGTQQKTALFHQVNVEGTRNVVHAAINHGVEHVVLISSVAVYGPDSPGVCTEATPCHPQSPYAHSKYEAEQIVTHIAEQEHIRLTILRPATVYGEGDPGNVARLMQTIDRDRFIWIGSGSNRKSLIHRDDVARACVAVIQRSSCGTSTYNIAAPPVTMRKVVETLAVALGKQYPSIHLPALPLLRFTELLDKHIGFPQIGRIHTTLEKWLADDVYDASAFQRAFNTQAQVTLEEGLQREVNWYRQRGL
jgi:nucleoside-diphosphate-sugar epimerase